MNKLTYQNNWNSDVYYVNSKQIGNLYAVEIDGEDYSVTRKLVNIPYSDMGHTYNAISYHYFIEKEVFGTKMTFDLNKIVDKVDVIALGYQEV